jgi:hypothetical protein
MSDENERLDPREVDLTTLRDLTNDELLDLWCRVAEADAELDFLFLLVGEMDSRGITREDRENAVQQKCRSIVAESGCTTAIMAKYIDALDESITSVLTDERSPFADQVIDRVADATAQRLELPRSVIRQNVATLFEAALRGGLADELARLRRTYTSH